MTDVVIVKAKRTAIGAFQGAFSTVPAYQLGAEVIGAVLDEARVAPEDVAEVVFGHVLTGGLGQNPARQASLEAGLPDEVPAWIVNQVCGSGLRAVVQACHAIRLGEARIVVAGGQENMTLSPHCAYLRGGQRLGGVDFVDTLIKDGLWCAMQGYHMGTTAENVAARWKIKREEQEAFAATSQRRAGAAIAAGAFKDEIVPVTVQAKKHVFEVAEDEHPRPDTTAEGLAVLKPAFDPKGTVTAGTASGINDGAAALLVMSVDEAERRGLEPMARIVSWGQAGVDPAVMGTGPIPAIRHALDRAGWGVGDLDLVELNEAFAAQALAVMTELKLDPSIVNVNGGAIALGHPLGASGARILVTLLHAMAARKAKRGLASLCIGGGMGIACCVERP